MEPIGRLFNALQFQRYCSEKKGEKKALLLRNYFSWPIDRPCPLDYLGMKSLSKATVRLPLKHLFVRRYEGVQ